MFALDAGARLWRFRARFGGGVDDIDGEGGLRRERTGGAVGGGWLSRRKETSRSRWS